MSTRLITWDERWLYIEHRIESGGLLICLAEVRAAFVGKDGALPPVQVLAAIGGPSWVAPKEPAWVQGWRELDQNLDGKPSEAVEGDVSWAH